MRGIVTNPVFSATATAYVVAVHRALLARFYFWLKVAQLAATQVAACSTLASRRTGSGTEFASNLASKGAAKHDRRISMIASRAAQLALAASLVVPSALAGEYTTFHHLEVTSGALQPCRGGMLLSLPASWRAGDGAVVLMTVGPTHDAVRDVLVSALLSEHAAVLELVPVQCSASRDAQESIIAGAIDGLDAMARTMGAGVVVAIGYGPGGTAILDVVREPLEGLLDTNRPRYAAAAAIGDGPASFALGESLSVLEEAPSRLAALCRALAAVVDGMGATPERDVPAAA